MAIVCSILIVAGMHWLCAWIYKHTAEKEKAERWKWQWSLSFYGALWLLFLAAMGITGVVHQVGWLVTSKEPVLVVRRHPWVRIRQAALEIHLAATDADWKIEVLGKSLSNIFGPSRDRKLLLEEFHVLFLPDNKGALDAIVFFSRDVLEREKTGFLLILNQSGNSEEQHPMRDLPEVLARYRSQ